MKQRVLRQSRRYWIYYHVHEFSFCMLFFRDTYLYFAQDNFSVSDDTKLSYRQVPVLFFSKIYIGDLKGKLMCSP